MTSSAGVVWFYVGYEPTTIVVLQPLFNMESRSSVAHEYFDATMIGRQQTHSSLRSASRLCFLSSTVLRCSLLKHPILQGKVPSISGLAAKIPELLAYGHCLASGARGKCHFELEEGYLELCFASMAEASRLQLKVLIVVEALYIDA